MKFGDGLVQGRSLLAFAGSGAPKSWNHPAPSSILLAIKDGMHVILTVFYLSFYRSIYLYLSIYLHVFLYVDCFYCIHMYKYTPHTHLNMNLGFYRPSLSSSKNCSNLGAPDHSLEIEVAVSAGEPTELGFGWCYYFLDHEITWFFCSAIEISKIYELVAPVKIHPLSCGMVCVSLW